LIFDGSSPDSARLTTWRYDGGPAIGFTEIVGPRDIRVGDDRNKVTAAFSDSFDLGDAIDVYKPFHLRFGFDDGDKIAWFGTVDCVASG
jgi:hypothetical protein